MSNKTIGNITYFEKIGTSYEIDVSITSKEQVEIYTKTSNDTNYADLLPNSVYRIENDSVHSTLIITDSDAIASVVGFKMIQLIEDVELLTPTSKNFDNVSKDLTSLNERINFIQDLIENRGLLYEDTNGDTQYPILTNDTFIVRENNKNVLKKYSDLVTWEDAGFVNDRTKVYSLIFNLSENQTKIETNLKEIPDSDLCFIDRVSVDKASTIGLSDGDFYPQFNPNTGFVEIFIKPQYKPTQFKLCYNIVNDGTSSGGGDPETINQRLEKFENIQELVNSNSSLLKEGAVVFLKGYYSNDDMAHHYRKIVSTSTSTSVKLLNGLHADIINKSVIDISFIGAKGDGLSDDTPYFLKAVELADRIKVQDKNYSLQNSMNIANKDIEIVCDKGIANLIIQGSNQTMFNFVNCGRVYFQGIRFIGNQLSTSVAIFSLSSDTISISKCSFENIGSALEISNSRIINIELSYFLNHYNKICNIINSDRISFKDCFFNNSAYANNSFVNQVELSTNSFILFSECLFYNYKNLNIFKSDSNDLLTIENCLFDYVTTVLETSNDKNVKVSSCSFRLQTSPIYTDVSIIKQNNTFDIIIDNCICMGYSYYLLFSTGYSNSFAHITNCIKNEEDTIQLSNIVGPRINTGYNNNFYEPNIFKGLTSINSLSGYNYKIGDIYFTNGFLYNGKQTTFLTRLTNGSSNTIGTDWLLSYSSEAPRQSGLVQLINDVKQDTINLTGTTNKIPSNISWKSTELRIFTIDSTNRYIICNSEGKGRITFTGYCTGGTSKVYTAFIIKNDNLNAPLITRTVSSGSAGIVNFNLCQTISYKKDDTFKLYFSGDSGQTLVFSTNSVEFSITEQLY